MRKKGSGLKLIREIKFRGESKRDGKWVYGHLVVKAGMPFIFSFGVIEPILVIPETVGQFTGLYDKNGKEIYEGDVLSKEAHWSQVVMFNDGCFDIVGVNRYPNIDSTTLIKDFIYGDYTYPNKNKFNTWEVIGNIHDNKELLEVKK